MQMKHWITGVTVAIALAFGMSTGASALVVETATIGVPGSHDYGAAIPTGSFDDSYAFTLSGADGTLDSFTTVFNSQSANIDVSSVVVSLYSYAGSLAVTDDPFDGSESFIASVSSASGTNPFFFTLSYLGLTEGVQYFVQVVGDLAGEATSGNYSVNVNVSNVPLPPAIWLFISALVGLVSFARIRRNGTPA